MNDNWTDEQGRLCRPRDAVSSRMRLRRYDYSNPGMYFVTICTQRRICHFGEIRDDQMVISTAGQVIESWWDSIPPRFPDVMLDARVVMPNHLHGIVVIGGRPNTKVGTALPPLSEIIRWFKSMSTRDYIAGVKSKEWPRFPGKLWQQGYYDHIVRNEQSLERIRAYIEGNPSRWWEDGGHPNNRL